jgi:predicted permease
MDWRTRQTSFAQAAAYTRGSATWTGGGEPLLLNTGRATPGLFPMLGATPVLGRTFDDDDAENGGRVLVLSYEFWQGRMGGAPDVVGREFVLDDQPHTVIGVLPTRFHMTGLRRDLWMPIAGPVREDQRENHYMSMIARLAPGVSIDRAQAETASILEGLSAGHSIQHGANLVPRLEDETHQYRTPLGLMLAASLVLLVVACVNVAAILLGIGIDRGQELAVRGAIGASRPRLVRQLVTESVALALTGALAGVLVAYGLTRALTLLAPPGIPRIDDVGVDVRIVAAAGLVATLVGILFGLAPALSLTGRDLVTRMRGVRVTGRHGRLHGGLVVAQLVLTTVLLVGAGLLSRTLQRLDAVDPGFDAEGVLNVRLSRPYARFMHGDTFVVALADTWNDRITSAISAVPGIERVAITTTLPYSGSRANNHIEAEGYVPAPGEEVLAERSVVSPGYIELMRMRVLEGRSFTAEDDRESAPKVTLVTRNLARRYWPDGAIGRRLKNYAGEYTVIGVIADTRDRSLDNGDDLRYYLPLQQLPGSLGDFAVRVAAGIDPASVIPALRERIWSVDPDVPIMSIEPLTERIADSLAEQRYRARLMGVFAALAALFAVLGVYGVTSRSVASRRREIGIRVALGERRSSVMRLILVQGVRLAAVGTALGLIAGVGMARLIGAFLYDTRPADPATLGFVGIGLIVLAGLASLAPSLRAARVEPTVALQGE